jgi:hypothetical protein
MSFLPSPSSRVTLGLSLDGLGFDADYLSSIDPFHEPRWQGVLHHRHAENSIVSQHLTSGLACFVNREI